MRRIGDRLENWILAIGLVLFGSTLQARDVVTLFDEALADLTPTRTEVFKSVSGTDLNAYIFEPEAGVERKEAGILWIHGGGWKAGSADQLFPQCAYFAKLGYISISIDYRLAADGGPSVFDCIEDCRDGFYWMVENADAFGIDPEKVVVAGESAGGHLAAVVGYIDDPRVSGIPDPQPWPVATIPINPITDMTAISWALNAPGVDGDTVLAESISPLYHVGPASVPALLLHGAADGVVPPAQSSDFAATMHAESRIANLRLWDGKGHGFFLYLTDLPGYDDKPIIHLSLLEIEAFLQSLKLNGYPAVHGHFSPVHLFDGLDGWRSFSELVPIGDKLFGSTYLGGLNDMGVVFSFDPATREYTVLHEFDGTDGDEIFTGLATDGVKIYGVGKFGGTYDEGTLFAMNLDGTGFSVLHHFNDTNDTGYGPHAAPILEDGVLYGTTYHGGSTTYGGALYKYTLPSGPYELIHSFTESTGRHPTGQMIRIGDWLYGTASDLFEHDSGYYGSLFRISMLEGHTFNVLHTFNGTTEGSHPYDDLYYDETDALIGTTLGKAFDQTSKGTIFSYSISGDTLTILHDFETRPGTGSKPNSGLIAIDGSGQLYGITHGSNEEGGDLGTLFRMDTDGSDHQIYHVFESGLLGNTPMRSLTYLDGALYGVAVFGGLTTDVSNPETGPGFIFRYQANSLSAEKAAYVNWLSGYDQLVNQSPDNDLEDDGLSLVEEFSFDGHPVNTDSGSPSTSLLSGSGGLRVEFQKVRAGMSGQLIPSESTDLSNWSISMDHATSSVESTPSHEAISFEWPASKLVGEPLFIQFEIQLPE